MCNDENIYFWRQVFVVSSGIFNSMAISFLLTFPGVINPAILNPNTTDIRATSDQASWLAASTGVVGTFGFVLNSYIMDHFGRRMDLIVLNISLIISWIICVFAKNIEALFVAKSLQGIAAGGVFINAIVISEYSHPERRGYFSAAKKFMQAVGMLISHGLTLCCTWRQIAAVAIIPAALSLIIACFWPESPFHLAFKGRFEECEESFTWLHGSSNQRQMELKELIAAQKERFRKEKQMRIIDQLRNLTFLKSFFNTAVITLVLDASGKYYVAAYVLQMMRQIFNDKYIATYCTLGADVLSIIALFASCFVIRMLKRRTVLFILGGFTISLMFLIGLINLLDSKVIWLIPSVMLLHYFMVNLSIIPLCFTLFGELFPIEFRGLGCGLAGIVMTTFFAVTMKVTPLLMEHTGIGGTYSTYGICLLLCFMFLFFTLPETKDKTLQEIEDKMARVKRDVEIEPMLLNKTD